MAHANIAFDIQSRRSREPEGLHISKNLRLKQATLRPGTAKPADQFVINRTSVLIDQLNPFVSAIMSVAIIYDDIKTIYKKKIGINIHIYLNIVKSITIYKNDNI